MLADRVLAGPASAAARASVLSTLGVLEQYAGSVPRAADRLAAAADLARGAQRVWALSELGATRFRLNDLAGLAECADRIAAVADLDDPEQRMLVDFMGGFASTVLGRPAAGRPLLTRALEALLSPPLRDDPRYLTHLLLVAAFRGDIDAILVIEAAAETRLALARERGALGVLVPALSLMAAGHAILGDHRRAFADAGEAAELGEQLGYVADTAVAVEMLAWQSAARGLHDDARRALAQATALTDRAGTTAYHAHHAITAGFCALSRGDPAEAVAVLEKRIAVDGGVGSMGEPLGIAPDLIEAYVGMGRLPDAAALARRYAAETPQPAPKSTEALISRSLALTADTLEEAESAFEAALAAHDEAYDAFEAARTRLLFGARLRRAGRRVAAREQLRSAVDAFTAMDLTAWQQRAAAELAATGASLRTASHATTEPLTSQETRVALLVARGLSNKEVAAALFLSPKTIEHHLAGVFRKRGFRSRTELARAMATDPRAASTERPDAVADRPPARGPQSGIQLHLADGAPVDDRGHHRAARLTAPVGRRPRVEQPESARRHGVPRDVTVAEHQDVRVGESRHRSARSAAERRPSRARRRNERPRSRVGRSRAASRAGPARRCCRTRPASRRAAPGRRARMPRPNRPRG